MNPLPPFELHRPESLDDALRLMAELESARPVAGGTDLLIALRGGAIRASNLVDLGLVKELRYIKEDSDRIRIGAATTFTDMLQSESLAEKAQVLLDAVLELGSVQVRNIGTLGGNLCNASTGADAATPLLVLGAEVYIASRSGSRDVPLTEFFTGPKKTCMDPAELLTEVSFPVPPDGAGGSFKKLGRRKGLTLSLINAAAYLELEGEECREARVAIGACAPTPIRIADLEEILRGKRIDDGVIRDATSVCYDIVRPSTREHARASEVYRREMSCVLAKRALTEAYRRARG